jgi:hypothetical protein
MKDFEKDLKTSDGKKDKDTKTLKSRIGIRNTLLDNNKFLFHNPDNNNLIPNAGREADKLISQLKPDNIQEHCENEIVKKRTFRASMLDNLRDVDCLIKLEPQNVDHYIMKADF